MLWTTGEIGHQEDRIGKKLQQGTAEEVSAPLQLLAELLPHLINVAAWAKSVQKKCKASDEAVKPSTVIGDQDGASLTRDQGVPLAAGASEAAVAGFITVELEKAFAALIRAMDTEYRSFGDAVQRVSEAVDKGSVPVAVHAEMNLLFLKIQQVLEIFAQLLKAIEEA